MHESTFVKAAALGCALLCGMAHAQTYPAKTVRIIVGLAPGGGNDAMARVVAQQLTASLKQQFVVDNRAGAGGLIAGELAAKSPPDGYTLLLGNVAILTIIPNTLPRVPYDALKDFQPVSLIATAPQLVVIHPSLPVKSMKDLITLAKARPGQLNYASNGLASSTHLATELFKLMTKTSIVHVPYKGLGPASVDLLAGQVQIMFSSAVAMMPHVRAGRLRALAMTGAKRAPAIPDIPTVAEAGVPGYEAGSWYGIVAPAGTPRPVVDTLSREVAAATRSREITDRLNAEGVVPVGSSPEEFAAHIKKEFARVGSVVKALGGKLE